MQNIYHSPQALAIITHVRATYGSELEFLWASSQNSKNAIWRHPVNRKWYGALLVVKENKIKPTGSPDKIIEILDLRFEPHAARAFAASTAHIYPGYHMNKDNWITIILDDSLPTATVKALLDQSYHLAAKAK